MAADSANPFVRATAVRKHFGGVEALRGVDLQINPGEVHGLVGENGSGKSTLVKVLSGYYTPDHGSIEVGGSEVSLPVDAKQHGIAVVHQDLGLTDQMTIEENLGVSSSYGSRLLGRISWKRERRKCRDLLREFGLTTDPDMLIGQLPPAERAMVAILRTLRLLREHADRHLLILDEPTAYLRGVDAARVLGLIQDTAASGSSVLFISHHLSEVIRVCDQITVLRDGEVVATTPSASTDPSALVGMMLGRDIGEFYPELPDLTSDAVLLSTSKLSGDVCKDISLTLHRGEILGFTGLPGAGFEELPYLLKGHRNRRGGTITLGDGSDDAALAESPIALVPGNRQRDGAWLQATAWENIALVALNRYGRSGWLSHRKAKSAAHDLMRQLGVRPLRPDLDVEQFSGGNQQKIVLAKWFQVDPKIFLLEEPTQGVDAGARKEIIQLIDESARNGSGFIIFSSDLEQMAQVCHRVIVLRQGEAVGELSRGELSEERLGVLAQA